MGMTQMGLDLNFSAELMLNVSFLELRFEKDLESHDKLGPFLSGQVDIAKLAFTQRSANFKITQLPTIFLVALGKIRMNAGFLQYNFFDIVAPRLTQFLHFFGKFVKIQRYIKKM